MMRAFRGGLSIAALVASFAVAAPAAATITQPTGKRGCAEMYGASGCAKGNGTQGAYDVAWSPDSRFLYSASAGQGYGAITIFRRQTGGAIRQLAGRAGCVSGDGRNGEAGFSRRHAIGVRNRCRKAAGLHDTSALALSPDGRFLIAASDDVGNGRAELHVFARNANSGALTLRQRVRSAMLDAAGELAMTGDGRLLAVAMRSGLLLLDRDVASGRLTPVAGGCLWSSTRSAPPVGCVQTAGIGVVDDVALSATGATLVTGGGLDDGVVSVLRRGADGRYAVTGCVREAEMPGHPSCAELPRLDGYRASALSADGTRLYVSTTWSSYTPEAPDALYFSVLLALTIDAAGKVAPVAGPGGCAGATGLEPPADCPRSRGFADATDLDIVGGTLFATWSGFGGGSGGRAERAAAIEAYALDAATGAIAPSAGAGACASTGRVAGCGTGMRGIDGTLELAPSPNGRALAVSGSEGAVGGFTR